MTTMEFLPDRLVRLAYWMKERESVRFLKETMLSPKPWTADPILQSTRFCNVRRMDDKVSRWLVNEWYPRAWKHQPLAAATLGRLINWPDALASLIPKRKNQYFRWDREATIAKLRAHRDTHGKVFTGAYIINAAGAGGGVDKIQIVCNQAHTAYLHPELIDPSSMESTHRNLMRIKGIGSFIAGQIVADLRQVHPGAWADRLSWAPIGPGSRRGMAWLAGWDGKADLGSTSDFLAGISWLMGWAAIEVKELFEDKRLEAHDIQNCLCEFDKFMRLTMQTGRAKNSYPGV